MLCPLIHHIADGDIAVVVLRNDVLRKFEGGFVAVFEPPANARIVGVDGAVILAAECRITVLRPKIKFHFRIPFLFHLFAQSAYLLSNSAMVVCSRLKSLMLSDSHVPVRK